MDMVDMVFFLVVLLESVTMLQGVHSQSYVSEHNPINIDCRHLKHRMECSLLLVQKLFFRDEFVQPKMTLIDGLFLKKRKKLGILVKRKYEKKFVGILLNYFERF